VHYCIIEKEEKEFNANDHSVSFAVKNFGISGKAMRDEIILYNYNVGLISEGAEAIASDSTENQHFSSTPTPSLSFDAPSPGNPSNIRINLIVPETRVTGLHLRV